MSLDVLRTLYSVYFKRAVNNLIKSRTNVFSITFIHVGIFNNLRKTFVGLKLLCRSV